ncbi:MAG: WYL domain-containing protein [Actinomycetales bacterium]|nr:WYL domain-containing protein [Actinomycetales bacterium]
MSSRRTERLLNLVICLLATRRWLTKEQIRAAVPQYSGCESLEAFDRMFERDKEDLRELGVPLVTGSDSAWFEDEIGYRIDADAYSLPEVDFSAEELAVLGLASRLWQQASLAGPAARALVKLRALGVEPDEDSMIGVEPRVRTAEPAFDPLYAATRDRAPVTFRYRKPSGEVTERHLEPWAVTGSGDRWYVVGHDRDRGASRAFRLSRVQGGVRRIGPPGSYTVPEDLDASTMIGMPEPGDDRPALVRVRPGRGGLLRRRGTVVRTADPAADAAGWDLIEVRVGNIWSLADEISGYGSDVVVVEPDDVRRAVVGRLTGALDAHRGTQPDGAEPVEPVPSRGRGESS